MKPAKRPVKKKRTTTKAARPICVDANTLLTDEPCPRCLPLARANARSPEIVQPLPFSVFAPLARQPFAGGKPPWRCCFDCASADTLMRTMDGLVTFEMARIAVGNDRRHDLRLPLSAGLVRHGLMRWSLPGDLKRHHAWLDRMEWFGLDNVAGG